MMNSEPLVPGPWANVTTIPSFTIVLTLFLSAFAMFAVKCTDLVRSTGDAGLGTVRLDRRRAGSCRWSSRARPPLSADVKVVYPGPDSVMVTPVAFALPMFFTVSV